MFFMRWQKSKNRPQSTEVFKILLDENWGDKGPATDLRPASAVRRNRPLAAGQVTVEIDLKQPIGGQLNSLVAEA
jgi:hypothetical protein